MLFGLYGFGLNSFGYIDPADDLSMEVATATIPAGARTIYLVEVQPYDRSLAATRTLRFSDVGFATTPSDTPANALFRGAVSEAFSYQKSLGILNRGRAAIPNFGVVKLTQHAGDLDFLLTDPLTWDDKLIEVRFGADTFAYDDFRLIFRGRIQERRGGLAEILFQIRSPEAVFAKPFLTTKYAGTGGVQGTSALTDQFVPACFGYVRDCDPVLVDPSNLIYQVHYAAIQDVEVRVGGVAWTKVAGTPGASQYSVDTANGRFTLGGSTPPSQPVTATVWGDARGSGYTGTAAGVLDRILRLHLGLTDDDIGLIGIGTAISGIYIRDGRTSAQVIKELVEGNGGWWDFRRDGSFTARLIDGIPSPIAVFEGNQIASLNCNAAPAPIWRFNVGYARTWRPLSEVEVAGSVSASERQRLLQPNSAVVLADDPLHTNSPLADEMEVPAIVSTLAEATTIANRLKGFFGTYREQWTAQIHTNTAQKHKVDVGDAIRLIKSDRLWGASGRDFFVDGISENAATGLTTFTLVT